MTKVDLESVPRSARELANLAKRKNWGWAVQVRQRKHDECLVVTLTRYARPQVTIQVRWHREYYGDWSRDSSKVWRENGGPWADFSSVEFAKEIIRSNPDVQARLSGV